MAETQTTDSLQPNVLRAGEVLQVDLPRPRNRVQMAEDPHYAQCRKAVIDFLYTRQAHVEKAA